MVEELSVKDPALLLPEALTEIVRGLSERELQVLRLTASGATNAEVAGELGLSVHAVKFHLASVYRKLGVGNRTEAAVVFLRSAGGVH